MERPPELRRSFLFVAGADAAVHEQALSARPDVLIQDLEDFTPDQLKQAARAAAPALYARCRAAGIVPAVRINLLAGLGTIDLAAVMSSRPALVLLPKAETAEQIAALCQEIGRLEALHGISSGSVEIVPTAETALGVVEVRAMTSASPRVKSALLGAEDLAADLCATRTPQGDELAAARGRFVLDCRAARIEPIDAPYTFSDLEGCARETGRSRQLGYRSKSTVTAAHVATIHALLTPGGEDLASARRVVSEFEKARAEGKDRVLVDGLWIEPPAYLNAKRLLARAGQFARFVQARVPD